MLEGVMFGHNWSVYIATTFLSAMGKVSKSIYLCDTEINLTTCSRLGAACAALRSPLRAVIGAENQRF